MRRAPLLLPEEERSLALRLQAEHDKATLCLLVESNLGLVNRLVFTEFRNSGHEAEDLVQEGILGLIEGIKRFDPDRGVRLATYVTYWIRSYLFNYVLMNYGQVPRGRSSYHSKVFFRLSAAENALLQQGEEVTVEALAKWLKVPKENVEFGLQYSQAKNIPLDAEHRSGDGSGQLLAESFSIDDDLSDDIAIRLLDAKRATSALASLSEREQEIVKSRFLNEDPDTLEEIGTRLGVSREWVRQIEAQALKKLRKQMEKP